MIIRSEFAKMQKLKAESLKKTEEMMQSAGHNLEKIEQEIIKSKAIIPESGQRLNIEIGAAKNQIKKKYDELKVRISKVDSS